MRFSSPILFPPPPWRPLSLPPSLVRPVCKVRMWQKAVHGDLVEHLVGHPRVVCEEHMSSQLRVEGTRVNGMEAPPGKPTCGARPGGKDRLR